MELYERVKHCAEALRISESALARAIGQKQSTFAGYLTPARQHKLWPLLPDILCAFPRVSRQWLYFEEGPALIGGEMPPGQLVPNASITDAAQQMLEQCGGSWAQLLRHILGMARQEGSSSNAETVPATNENYVQELLALQRENRRLSQELIEAKDKIISLLERDAAPRPDTLPQAATNAAATPLSVPGTGRNMTS